MRKLYLFFVMLCTLLGIQTANANFSGNWTAYLNPGVWNTGGAWFALYVHNNEQGPQWVQMTDSDGDGYYSATVPDGDWTNIIFVRMNSSSSISSLTSSTAFWDAKWDQSQDMADTYGYNCYSISGWGTGSVATGSWSNYTPSSSGGDDTTTTTWTVYFDNTVGNWSAVYAYVWDASNDSYKPLGDWAGTQISYDSTSGYYKCTFTANSMTTPKIIFNSGSSSNQTSNLELKNNWVYSSNGAVKEYDGTGTGGGGEDEDPVVDPDESNVKYKVVLRDNGGTETEFTQDSEKPWLYTLENATVNKQYSGNYYSYVFRIYTYTYTSETEYTTSYKDYTTTASGVTYWSAGTNGEVKDLHNGGTFQFGSEKYYFAVTAYDGVLYQTIFDTSSVDTSKLSDPTPEVEAAAEASANLNMPLKRADFANGPRYFVVGTRMSEWRLQPEWELLDEDGDGTYTLNNRLMYTGMMGIAKVESFDDYIFQRYTFYAVNTAIKGNASLTLSKVTNPKADLLAVTCAESVNKFTAINYGKSYTHNQFTESNTIVWGSKTDLGDADILEGCGPTYVQTISITDNGDSGIAFTISGASTDAATIAQYRTFSLVGSAINYVGAEWEGKTPLRNDSEGPTDWQEAWIQYDNYGKPYYDAYGNTMYQTVFQREWLKNHPTMFKAEDGFEYNSLNIVFNYDSAQTHDATIPASGEQAWTTKDSSVSSPNKSYSATVSTGSAWQCFVVENMWLVGQFKVWTGWGGADKKHDGSGTGTTDARWYYENGGHHIGSDWTISADKTVYYATDRDINNADFDLSSRIFARYVKVWWDPAQGFDNSFIQLITEVGGPEISCERVPDVKHKLQYTWTVPYSNGLENYSVKNIRIDRYRIDAEGNQTVIEGVYSQAYSEGALVVTSTSQPSGTDVIDPNEAEGGWYWYKIYVDYYGNESAEEKTDFTRDAESNRVYIYYETIPDKAIVKQLAYNEAAGTSEAADDAATKYWSFDLRLTASAPVGYEELTAKNAAGEEVALLSLVDYYVVGVPKTLSHTGMSAAKADGTAVTIASLTESEIRAMISAEDAENYQFTENNYYGVAPDAANNYAMPAITFENVVPDNYRLYVSMGASDGDFYTDGTENTWATYNVASAYADVEMVKPGVGYSVTELAVNAVDGNEVTTYTVPTLGQRDPEQPVEYHNTNMVSTTDGKFDQLMVVNKVLSDWTITYDMDVKISAGKGDGNAVATAYSYSSGEMNNKVLNAVGGVEANFEYLPIIYDETTPYSDHAIKGIQGYTSRELVGADIEVADVTVTYARDDKSASVSNKEVAAQSPTLSEDDQLTGYEVTSQYYSYQVADRWNGFSNEVSNYTNAFAVIEIATKEGLNDVAGYYSSNIVAENGGAMAVDPNNNETPFPAAGGVVIDQTANKANPDSDDDSSGYNTKYLQLGVDNFVVGNAEKNYAEGVANKGNLPIKIWHVGEGSDKPSEMLYTLLTADYPIVVKPTLTAVIADLTISPAAVDGGLEFTTATDITPAMVVLSYDNMVNTDWSGASTDIEDVVVDGEGEIRIYPNPAVDVVTVAGSAALGTVEIYSLDGRLVKVVEAEDYSATIAVGDLAKGTYVIRAGGMTERMIKM